MNQDNGDSGKKHVRQSGRKFRGNLNYVNFYNRHVQETFAPKHNWLHFSNSKLTHDGKVYYSRDFRDQIRAMKQKEHVDPNSDNKSLLENCPGTLWTRAEKEIFFDALLKCSIHRIDLIQFRLPGKSELEILAYYDLLKAGLQKARLKKRKTYDYEVNGQPRKIQLTRNTKHLMKYSEIPIAYEMSEYFIKFEELQSELISIKEKRKENDYNTNYKSQFKKYTEIVRREVPAEFLNGNSMLNKNEQREAPESAEEQQIDPQLIYTDREQKQHEIVNKVLTIDEFDEPISQYQTLLKLENFQQITDTFYLQSNITDSEPYLTSKFSLGLGYDALLLLEALAKQITRKIIANIVQKVQFQRSLAKSRIHNPNEEIYIKIQDVMKSILSLGYREPDDMFNKDVYWRGLVDRLKCDKEEEDKYLLKDRLYLKFHLLLENNDLRLFDNYKDVHVSSFSPTQEDVERSQDDGSEEDEDPESAIPHISTLLAQTRKSQRRGEQDRENVEEKLLLLAEDALERRDRDESTMHEHGLLTYLSTDQDGICPPMYTTEEAEEVLRMWDLEIEEQAENLEAGEENDLNETSESVQKEGLAIDDDNESSDENASDDTDGHETIAMTEGFVASQPMLENYELEFARYERGEAYCT